jgi:hypothetical protein
MSVQDMSGWVNTQMPSATFESSASEPSPAPVHQRAWLGRVAVVAGLIVAAGLGAGAGFFVADDGDEVRELQEASDSLADDIQDLEDDLAEAAVAQGALRLAVGQCVEATDSTDVMLEALEDFDGALNRLIGIPNGSLEELEAAGLAFDSAYIELLATSRSVRLAADDCTEAAGV